MRLFCKKRFFLIFLGLVFLSPLGLYAERSFIAELESKVQEYSAIVDRQERDLISCRNLCVNRCQDALRHLS